MAFISNNVNRTPATSNAVFGFNIPKTTSPAPATNFGTANSTAQTAAPIKPANNNFGFASPSGSITYVQPTTSPSVKGLIQPPTVIPKTTTPTTPAAATSSSNSTNSVSPTASAAAPSSPAPIAPAPKPTTYANYVSGLVSTAKPSAAQTQNLAALEQASAANQGIGQQAENIAQQYGQKIAEVGRLGAGAQAGDLSTGTSVVGQGNAAIASQSASAQQQALAQGEQAALEGTGQALTANQQQIGGLTSALGGANTQQQIAQGAYGTAAGLAQPTQAAYGQTVFNPLTGQYESGGGLPPEVMQQYAKLAANGNYSAIPTSITGNPVLSAQLNAAASQINPNYSPLQSEAQGQNIATQTTTGTNIASTGLTSAVQNYVQMKNYADAASSQANDLLNVLNTTNLNGTPLLAVNQTLNAIGNETSDPNVKSLQVAAQEAQALYSRLLSTGGATPTANDTRALNSLDGNSTPKVTAAAIQQLNNSVSNMLNAQYKTVQTYSQNLGGNTSSYSSNTGGSTGGSSIYNF